MTDSQPARPPVNANEKADDQQRRLRLRLEAEGAFDLLKKMAKCGEGIVLKCTCCNRSREGRMACRKKWCPRCQRTIAAEASERMTRLVAEFRAPLFLTLTMPNEWDLKNEPIIKLKRAVKRLRRCVAWKFTVAGGIAGYEVTNTGKGYHVHVHIVLDSTWLSDGVPPPHPRASRSEKEHTYMLAKMSMEDLWAWCCGVPKAVLHMKRCNRRTIAKEVVKYAVKGSELLDQREPIAPILRAIDAGRMRTTFGHCQRKSKFHLKVLDVMKEEDDRPGYDAVPERLRCCQDPHPVPIQFHEAAKSKRVKRIMRSIRKAQESRERANGIRQALLKPFKNVTEKGESTKNVWRTGKKTTAEFRAEMARAEVLTRWAVSDPSRAAKAALRG